MNPYKTLGLEEDCTDEDIRRAYRKLSKDCHPDIHGDESRPLFENLKKAHDILLDADQRAEFDEYGTVSESTKDKIKKRKDMAITVILECVNQFAQKVMMHEYKGQDLKESLISSLMYTLEKGESAIAEQTKRIKRLSDFVTRIRSKGGISLIIAETQKNTISMFVKDRNKNREMKEAVIIALEMIEDLDFDCSVEEAMQQLSSTDAGASFQFTYR